MIVILRTISDVSFDFDPAPADYSGSLGPAPVPNNNQKYLYN